VTTRPNDDSAVDVVYRIVDAVPQADLNQLDALLSADERERRDRFRFPEAARIFSVAHGVKRRALSRHAARSAPRPEDWRFWCDPLNKPHIVEEQAGEPSLQFNLSHCRLAVAVAIARGTAIGIDVEERRRPVDHDEIARRFFAESEVDMMSALGPAGAAVRFFELWTLKEAYLKALGKGLTRPLKSVVFRFDGDDGVRLAEAQENRDWTFVLAALDNDCPLAVAINRRQDPRTFTFWDDASGGTGSVRILRTSIHRI
jgi:4'-phosphopantetheinyl transferase